MNAELSSSVKAVIAVGGVKSRAIDPVSVSKALVPIVNKPAFIHTLETFKKVGITEAFVIFSDDEVETALKNQRLSGMAVHAVLEKQPRGTAGCLKPVEDQLLGHTIVLAAGLVFLSSEDLKEMVLQHRSSAADVTVGLVEHGDKEPVSERVLLGGNNEIEDVIQVHASIDRRSQMRTSGIYVLESKVLEHIPPNKFMDIKEQLIPRLRRRGMKISGWVHKKHSIGIRSIGDYLRMNFELLRNRNLARPHLEDYQEINKQVWVGKGVQIDSSATLVRPLVIGDNTRIDKNVTIVGPAVIGPRCQLEKDSFVRESVFLADSCIPANVELDRCLISGKIFSLDNGYCRESIILDGEPFLDGVGAALGGVTVHKVVQKEPGALKKLQAALYPRLKRIIDISIALFALLITLPVWAIIAVIIKLDSKGPVLFVQTRCGKAGKSFEMIKFRTMVKDADRIKHHIQHLNQSDGPMFKIFGDPRETRSGKFLRMTKLDELPQLLNVLRGDMSIVGPRPLSMNEMRYNPHWRDVRLKVHQGMTGLWQINGTDTHNFHEWIRNDLQYVDECSSLLDLKIIFLTLLKSLRLI